MFQDPMQIVTSGLITEPDIFACESEFMDFFKYEGNAAQWTAAAWDSGYRSVESVAHASEDELLFALGGAAPTAEHIYVFHSFCKARGGQSLVTGVTHTYKSFRVVAPMPGY